MITCDSASTLPLPLREGDGGRGPTTQNSPPPRTGPLRNGNHRGNPNAAPRCGAKNRAGTPCRAPAMPNGRCHLHGGKCTGPRTPEGKARSATANTKHGNCAAPHRIRQRYIRTLIKRSKLKCDARLLYDYLPPEMAARLGERSPELWTPIHPSNEPYVFPAKPPAARPATTQTRHSPHAGPPSPTQPRTPARPLPRALAAERQAARAEAASQAPWRHAIAQARAAKRQATAAKRAATAARRATRAANRAAGIPTPHTKPRRTRHTAPSAHGAPKDQLALLEREFAARKAGLRVRPIEPPQPVLAAGGTPYFANPRINLMNPERAKNRPAKIPGINPMDREPRAASVRPRPAPLKALALRTTTLANTWQPSLRTALATRFTTHRHHRAPIAASRWTACNPRRAAR